MANISGKSPSLVEEDEVGYSRTEDRISLLPESLQCHILSFLTTQETVRTSVLSSTWRSLWACVPRFELHSSNFPNDEVCVDFIDKFLTLQIESCLREFNLCIEEDDNEEDASLYEPCLGKLMKRKIQDFQVYCLRASDISLTLPVCEALVSLKLYSVKLNDLGSRSFPCLKILYLFHVKFPEPLVLDTPRLEELRLVEDETQFKSFKIISMSDSVKVALDVNFELDHQYLSERNLIYNLLNNFSDVRDMKLTRHTLEMIYCLHHMNPLPKFRNLTHLGATMVLIQSAELLPCVLESCPNLKHLILNLIDDYTDIAVADTSLPSKPPSCMVSSLECVEMRSDITETETERELVRYFLDKATKLKKLVLHLNVYGEKPPDFGLWKQNFDSPRRSASCQFEVLPVLLKRRKSSY